jgi:hypothetical protein
MQKTYYIPKEEAYIIEDFLSGNRTDYEILGEDISYITTFSNGTEAYIDVITDDYIAKARGYPYTTVKLYDAQGEFITMSYPEDYLLGEWNFTDSVTNTKYKLILKEKS